MKFSFDSLHGIGGISAADFSYALPQERIAEYPLKQRDRSRLLVLSGGDIVDTHFHKLIAHLEPGSHLVLNNTRVVQARLVFYKATGARIEVFCLEPLEPVREMDAALQQRSPVRWRCLIGNVKKWKSGKLFIQHPSTGFSLSASLEQDLGDSYAVDFYWQPDDIGFGEALELAGKTPLPPYIQRDAVDADRDTYQTIFARAAGSVAAPTAGLHFTPALLAALEKKRIPYGYVTLHVGAGTFKPVTSSTIGGHQMHEEQFLVDCQLVERLISWKGPLVSVGTTSMRTLESLYWLGANIISGKETVGDKLFLSQWAPYEWRGELPGRSDALGALLQWARNKNLHRLTGETALMIVPGYRFSMVDLLLTNFHQPGSTLLLLVAAFIGDDWRKVYNHALKANYRFLSYGDSCLFFKNQS